MKRKNINIIIPLVVVLAVIFVAFLQGPGWTQQNDGNKEIPSSPKESKYGKPLIENKPDSSGKFKVKIPAPRETQRLMNPNEQYPPPGLKKALNQGFMILFIITAIIIYYLFIHRNLKKLVPALGVISSRIKGSMGHSTIPAGSISVVEREKLSNEAIIRDMVIEMEKDNESREHLFRSFSLSRALPETPQLKELGIENTDSGLYVILADDAKVSRTIINNIVLQSARLDQPMIFLSPRICMEDIARGVIALETRKPWEEMDEQERYRISRQVEDFMEKYQGIYSLKNLKTTAKEIDEIIKQVKNTGKITSIVIDDFSIQMSDDWDILISRLKLDSKKEGIPVFITDEIGNKTRWESYKDRGVNSLLEVIKSGENLVVNDLINQQDSIRKININSENGALELISG